MNQITFSIKDQNIIIDLEVEDVANFQSLLFSIFSNKIDGKIFEAIRYKMIENNVGDSSYDSIDFFLNSMSKSKPVVTPSEFK